LYLAPVPKRISTRKGTCSLADKRYAQLIADDVSCLLPALKQSGLDLEPTAGPHAPRASVGLVIRLDEASGILAEGYALTIKPDVIEIKASTPAGAFYGACTLAQIARQSGAELPCLLISDWPDFPDRGVMLDISRDKVPTMETIFGLVDLLASWKINQFQLYTEHTFGYLAHPEVWEKASPITGAQILELDAYCRSKFVELVPNQNSFGHMERWLKFDDYRPMAESPNGGETSIGIRFDYPFSLCPTDRRSVRFLAGLYDELLPHFTSGLFNVGCDETFDLGYGRSKDVCKRRGAGRVYLDFLLEIHRLVSDRGRKMMFWGDIIMHHPELIADLPGDAIALEWGYEYDHPFAEHGAKFAESGVPFYVCPGASNWGSLAGRTDNAIGNITSAARNGLANGAIGLLNTSWGDHGHWDPLPVAYLGFMVGAMSSWNSAADVKRTIGENLSLHAFGDPTLKIGAAFRDLGNTYKVFKKRVMNSIRPWQILFSPMENAAVVEGVTIAELDAMESLLRDIEAALSGEAMSCCDSATVRRELAHVISMLRLASVVGRVKLGEDRPRDLESRVEAVREEHRAVWLLRNRVGGLDDSASKLRIE